MADRPEQLAAHVVASYRYLRLALVVLVVALGASLTFEITLGDSPWLSSISAYYWTPVHAVFVGVLFAIGASLVALKGHDDIEDMFFNLAGVLAPVVALVPAKRPDDLAGNVDAVSVDPTALVQNNVPALGIAVAVGFLVALVVARHDPRFKVEMPRVARVGLGLALSVLLAGVAWYAGSRESFEDHAHLPAAAVMFFAIWCAVMVNAGWPSGQLPKLYRWLQVPVPPPSRPVFLAWYRRLALFMVAALLASLVLAAFGSDHWVFIVEALEIAPFGAFWLLQTVEGWDTGFTKPNVAASGEPPTAVTPVIG
jgi:hypothetical protein